MHFPPTYPVAAQLTPRAVQHNGHNTSPGGLIEGVADFVRLRAGLAPPHWRRRDDASRWDAGYQHTAYFLDWLEDKRRFGPGTVRRLNEKLRTAERYVEAAFWPELLGRDVADLWREYRDEVLGEGGEGGGR